MAKLEASKKAFRLNITLVYSPAPRQVREWVVDFEPGTTVIQALLACSIFKEYPELANKPTTGIWGRKVRLNQPLADKDRIEIYRPLRVDPKTARRVRFDRQGVKSAGLFTRKRLGAKAGY
jgi:putative ubiquitin-RnfH superfamily antitoxin RatB of RatAB toxin-antitoxin module